MPQNTMNQLVPWCSLSLLLLTSCATTDGSQPFLGGGGSAGNSGLDGSVGGAADGAADGAGDAAVQQDSSTGQDVEVLDAGPSGDGTITPDQACAAEHVEAERLPLDLYLMMDRSQSMSNEMPNTTTTFWEAQENALNAFFNDSQSTGISIALRFFPLDDTDEPQDEQCSGDAYAQPLVTWGELPSYAGTLTTAISQVTPEGAFTPTEEALRGVLRGAEARKAVEPDHVVAAVLVSDGRPCCVSNKCPANTAAELGAIAATYASADPPIETYAIYLAFEPFEVMETIAQEGGTNAAFDATGGQQAFVDALNEIRKNALGCEYKMPTSNSGVVEPDLVEVQYTPGGSSTAQTIERRMTEGECSGQGGWYYDDNVNPTKLVLCPTTCDEIQDDSEAKLDILVGCIPVHR